MRLLSDEFLAELESADDAICNALAEKYPMNWDSSDIERHKEEIRKLIESARAFHALAPLLRELVESNADLMGQANFKHGDGVEEYLKSECLMMEFAREAANTATKIADIMREGE